MSGRVLRVLLLAGALGGCSQYGRVIMEFDSISQFNQVGEELAQLEYQQYAMRWPWTIRLTEGSGIDWFIATMFAVDPEPMLVENPSGFARERMTLLVDLSGDHLDLISETSVRLLWVASRDKQVLNQIVATQGMARLLKSMGVDPLDRPSPAPERAAAIEEAEIHLATLRDHIARTIASESQDDAQRQAYLDALTWVTQRPLAQAVDDRTLIRLLLRAEREEREPELIEPTRQALVDALANALSQGVRNKLFAASPDVREAAVVSLYRLSGPRAIPYTLRALSFATLGRTTYDQSRQVRLTWLRLCAQVPLPAILETFAGGPSGIEFMYDTVRDEQDPELQTVALQAMAMSLGKPILFERD